LEETHIFPAIRNAGGEAAALVDVLLAQHARGREITDFVLNATRVGNIASGQAAALAQVLTSFSRMYEAHAAREDTILFPAFRAALPDDRYAELGEQFEEIEHREFGEDGFDHAVAQVTGIEQRLGLSDLASFTAPALRA
jgi:hemerythrin-like domain-containing protein